MSQVEGTVEVDAVAGASVIAEETASAERPVAEANPEAHQAVFGDLPLSQPVQLAVQASGYISPTPVQEQIIPLMLSGVDVLAQSQTGTGKTAAFALPVLSQLELGLAQTQILVLTPTRELAMQVAKSFETYGQMIPKLRIAAITGGADYQPQLRQLKAGAQIVVGTPGRVIDHLKRGSLRLESMRCLVLDEADEMLNMGFIDDVEFVLNASPAAAQIALFSATMPPPIRKIADQYLKEPATVTIRRKTLTAEAIEQKCVIVEQGDKSELLARMLEVEDTDGVIVFTKTKDSTVRVAEGLLELGFKAAALNGDLPQARRQRTVDQLKAGKLDVLVATDVAARGLDVQRISHVFNFDLPHDGESYVHRIGRTGRAGRSGVAVIFLTHRQRGKLRLIEKLTKQRIQIIEPPTGDDVTQVRIARFKQEIEQACQSGELSMYSAILADVVQSTGKPLETVAAAVAHLARGGRPLVAKDRPRAKRDKGPGRPAREERGFRRGESRSSKGPEAGMQRYWIGVGHDDGVRPTNIVGAVANEAGIRGREIGAINIRDQYSTVDLPEGLAPEVLQVLQSTWVSGKQLRIRPFEERGNEGRKGRRTGKGPTAFAGKRKRGPGAPWEKKSPGGHPGAKAHKQKRPGKNAKKRRVK